MSTIDIILFCGGGGVYVTKKGQNKICFFVKISIKICYGLCDHIVVVLKAW